MALTLNANWLAAFQKERVELRVLMTITTAVGTTFKFLSGLSSTMSYPASVISISTIGRHMEVPKREPPITSYSALLHLDGYVSDMVVNNRLRGKKVELWLGASDLVEGDYTRLAAGQITEALPIENAKQLRVKISEHTTSLTDVNIVGYWLGRHKLTIAKNILEKVGIAAADIVAAEFTPANFPGISHMNVASGVKYPTSGSPVGDAYIPMNAAYLLGRIAGMLDGLIWVDEQGRFRFSLFDSAAAAVRTLADGDDIRDLEQVDAVGAIYNRISVQSHWSTGYGTMQRGNVIAWTEKYTLNDTDSQTNHAWPGEPSRILEYEITDSWKREYGILYDEIDSVATTIVLEAGQIYGFAGTRWETYPSGSQPADAALSASRKAYIKIDDEIIECATNPTISGIAQWLQPDWAGGFDTVTTAFKATYTNVVRGAKGTTAVAHGPNALAVDVTDSVLLAEKLLTRWSNGAPIIEITTNLRHIDLQIADLIAITSSRYKTFGKSSLDANTKWEIIGKDVVLFGEEPHIKFTLAWGTDTAAPAPTQGSSSSQSSTSKERFQSIYAMLNEDVGSRHVVSGLTVSQVSGLTARVAVGVVSGIVGRNELEKLVDRALTASKDTYIRRDIISGHIIYDEVANGAAEPTLRASQIRLAKVVTDATTITSVLDQRVTKALVSSKFAADPLVLLDNPNFEQGDIGWPTKGTGWSVSGGNARNGTFNGQCAIGGAGDSVLKNSRIFKVRPGDRFRIEGWFKSTAGAAGTAKVRLAWLDAAFAQLSTIDGVQISAGTTYTESLVTGIAPSTAIYARVELVVNANTAGTWYVDDVACRPVLSTEGIALAGAMVFNSNMQKFHGI